MHTTRGRRTAAQSSWSSLPSCETQAWSDHRNQTAFGRNAACLVRRGMPCRFCTVSCVRIEECGCCRHITNHQVGNYTCVILQTWCLLHFLQYVRRDLGTFTCGEQASPVVRCTEEVAGAVHHTRGGPSVSIMLHTCCCRDELCTESNTSMREAAGRHTVRCHAP